MIIEIALGIVLAVIILAFLPYIIRAGFVLMLIGLVIVAIVIAVNFISGNALSTKATLILLVIVIAAILLRGVFLQNEEPINHEGVRPKPLNPGLGLKEQELSPMIKRIREFKKANGISKDSKK